MPSVSSGSAFRRDEILQKQAKPGNLSKRSLNRRREGWLAKEGSAGGAAVQLPAQAKPTEILAGIVQSQTASTWQLLPGFTERILIRAAACLGSTRTVRLPLHSLLEEPTASTPLRSSSQSKLPEESCHHQL